MAIHFCHADLNAFYALHCTSGASTSLLATPMTDTSRYGRVCVDASSRITSFVEKNSEIAAGPGLINAGVYLLDSKALEKIPVDCEVSLERQVLPEWLAESSGMGVCTLSGDGAGRCSTSEAPESLQRAQAFFPPEQPAMKAENALRHPR